MRLYVSNASYPELREIGSAWERHCAWWRAFRSAVRDPRFWLFGIVEFALLTVWPAVMLGLISSSMAPATRGFGVGAAMFTVSVVAAMLLATTWGGDLIRPHLRKTTRVAREACPRCGHQLTSHLEDAAHGIRCPECGLTTPRSAFEPPFLIPRECLAVGRWGRGESS